MKRWLSSSKDTWIANGLHIRDPFTNLIDPLGGNWNILTGAAFLSFIIPMIVSFSFQKNYCPRLALWVC